MINLATRLKSLMLGAMLMLPPTAFAATPLDTASFTTVSGQSARVSAGQGRVLVVNFWATWCGPCREELPMLDRLAKPWKGQGIDVVGIAMDTRIEVNNYLKFSKLTLPVLIGNAETLNLSRALGNHQGGLPFTVVFDRQGKQVATLLGKLDEKTITDTVMRYR
ncbi:TlpA family protein disulfide reductase [Paludibacterium paludis]|uniref:Thioredoxin domain-containing protein n=1 Tax=Paludibacterium paludis TaxID=1225769 RepID=A0A918NZP5_9NEIS|nr:TlpA disulfide reductase family protein [Paludibacterium paludis]GGY09697.1 hypothetical protein GCM10011289_10700 [Paludibacterium paludis]